MDYFSLGSGPGEIGLDTPDIPSRYPWAKSARKYLSLAYSLPLAAFR